MKIIREAGSAFLWNDLRDIAKGAAVMFRSQWHQDMCVDDLYIVIDASAYPAKRDPACYKIAVVNLRTGRLSYLSKDRQCRPVDAEVRINE